MERLSVDDLFVVFVNGPSISARLEDARDAEDLAARSFFSFSFFFVSLHSLGMPARLEVPAKQQQH